MQELNDLKKNLSQKFKEKFDTKPEYISVAPGRINIIGEHTDYNFGFSMPSAINRWVLIGFSFRDDNRVNVYSDSFNSSLEFKLGVDVQPTESWHKFFLGAMQIFLRHAAINKGFNAYIWGNVPLGSGVSSSAAIEVASMNLFRKAFKGDFDDVQVVKNCQMIEHEFLKVNSGLLDQYSSQFSRKGQIMVLDFQSITHQYVESKMGDWVWVLANTKVKRELAGSKYSERVEETSNALETIMRLDKSVKHFRDVTIAHLDLIQKPLLRKRLTHFVLENQRVHDAVIAFKKQDMLELGKLLVASHNSLRDDYEVSCPELDFLVETALEIEGCSGARMMGGGFGGCTINLVKKSALPVFTSTITKAYKKQFNIVTEIEDFILVDGAICEKA